MCITCAAGARLFFHCGYGVSVLIVGISTFAAYRLFLREEHKEHERVKAMCVDLAGGC